jgi:lysophospholipase
MAVDETKVLLVYTGGTIGMMLGPTGYRPEPYFLTESLRSQAWFHDPLEHSIFSHAGSSAGFREWSTQANGTQSAPTPPAKTLLVRSSRPIGAPAGQPGEFAQVPTCRQVSEDVYEADLPSLVTPKSSVHGMPSKRIRYAVLEVRTLHVLRYMCTDLDLVESLARQQ